MENGKGIRKKQEETVIKRFGHCKELVEQSIGHLEQSVARVGHGVGRR